MSRPMLLRSSLRLLSSRRSAAAAPQYPALALYRSILRAHQQLLPDDARDLGDSYVRKEFELHRGASDDFRQQFERQWRDYLTTLRSSATSEQPVGREMTPEEIAAMSDEQKVQLLKIREETAGPPRVE